MPEVEPYMLISDNFRRIKKEHPFSVSDLSKKSGLGKKTIYHVINGENASIQGLWKLAQALNIDISEFFKQGE